MNQNKNYARGGNGGQKAKGTAGNNNLEYEFAREFHTDTAGKAGYGSTRYSGDKNKGNQGGSNSGSSKGTK